MSGFDWPNHFSWIFSTFAQSFAAIIGVIGVLAVFRLQIQHNIVRESFEKLREVILTNDTRGNQLIVSGMNFEQILEHKCDFNNFFAKKKIDLAKEVDQQNSYIESLKNNPGASLFCYHEEIREKSKGISEINTILGRLTLLSRECTHGRTEQHMIAIRAYNLTCDLGVILFISLIALLDVKQLSKNPQFGYIVAWLVIILVFFICQRGLKFLKLCLLGGFMYDAFEKAEQPKGLFKLKVFVNKILNKK